MRSVIVCEGRDDLWFISYYLHKALKWNECDASLWCKSYNLSAKSGQKVFYMTSPDEKHQVSIFSSGGQNRLDCLPKEWLTLNEKNPSSAIDAIIIFRDCDDRSPDELAHSMNNWFADCTTWLPSHFVLNNNEPVLLRNEIDEVDVSTTILPVIIPFDEAGAIETLLLQAIEDSSDDGKRIAQSSREYIRQFEDAPLSQYLNKQRLRTKAKYSAAVAITNPDHSTGTFMDFMLATPWEQSASIKTHMEKVVQLITGQLQ